MSEWQPIETAPKDRAILGWTADPDADGDPNGFAIVKWVSWKWSVLHDHEDWVWSEYWPTHWMPLPDPPQQKAPTHTGE